MEEEGPLMLSRYSFNSPKEPRAQKGSPGLIDGSGCLKRMGFGVGWLESVSLEQAIRVRESQTQSPGGRLGSRPPTEMLVHLFLLPLLLL